MRGIAQESDVCTRTEDLVVRPRHHDASNFRMLEPKAVYRIMEFDVDGQIVAVELEIVQSRPHGVVFFAFDFEIPVHVLVGVGFEADGWVCELAHADLRCDSSIVQ